jgi:hypothetical protein
MSEREAIADAVIQKAQPLNFSADCFRWMQPFKEESQADIVIEEESLRVVAQSLVARIREAAISAPLYLSFGDESRQLFWYWQQNGSPGEMERYLKSWLLESADAADAFLKTFTGRAWGMESGVSRRADFDRSAYDSVASFIAADFIVQRLAVKYGEDFKYDQEEGAPNTQQQWERRTASRFLEIHRFVLAEKQDPNGTT